MDPRGEYTAVDPPTAGMKGIRQCDLVSQAVCTTVDLPRTRVIRPTKSSVPLSGIVSKEVGLPQAGTADYRLEKMACLL